MPRDTIVSENKYAQEPYIFSTNPSLLFLFIKRIVDIATALLLLPIIIFVCVIALILNPFLNPGKLFYQQERVGKNNVVFQIYKLRTMQGDNTDPKFATDEHARITPLGKFMRDIHVDELPQIFNVLSGSMSLIGPRPEQPEFFLNYAMDIEGFTVRQSVRPGISGLAQLRCGYTDCHVGARRKLKWDIEYIRHRGFALESRVYLQTYGYIFPRIANHLIALIKRPK